MRIHLLEINQQTLARPNVTTSVHGSSPWRLLSRCESDQADSCLLLNKLVDLAQSNARDGKSALAALDKLMHVAVTGKDLASFYNKKQSHPIHDFVYKGAKHVIWRIRNNDVRITFYYAQGKIIFLTDAIAKRKDKLTKGEEKQLEDEIKIYIDAEEEGRLVLISTQEEQNVKE